MQGRIKYLDMARCIALLWIVGFWHLQGSLTNDLSFWGDMDITCIMVGLFMFLSGFFMSKYRFDGTWKSFFSFMQKRFKRFYILYMIATILFFGIGYFGEKWMVVFTTLTALSTYILPQPLTLWFISMLFSFYFVTPFIMKHNIYYASSSAFLFFMLGYTLHNLLPGGIDYRFFWCFPLYCLGLYSGRRKWLIELLRRKVWGGIFTVLLFLVFLALYVIPIQQFPVVRHLHICILPIGIGCVLFYSYLCVSYLPSVNRIVEPLAYCSMSAYLFHRPIYLLLSTICQYWRIDLPPLITMCLFFSICIFCSYLIQIGYDRAISKVTKNLRVK